MIVTKDTCQGDYAEKYNVGVFYFVYALLAWQCSFLIVYLLSKPIRLLPSRSTINNTMK